MRRGALLGCVLFAAMPATASASTFSVHSDRSGTYISYEAAAGETNDVIVSTTQRGRLAIVDNGVAAITPPSDPAALNTCVVVANRLSCKYGVNTFPSIYLGDGDDTAQSGVPVTAHGGPGADAGGGEGMRFDGGPGPDHIIGFTGSYFVYGADQPGDLTITLDGVANDGHPGEGDEVRPGQPVVIQADGNDTVVGSQYSDYIVRSGGTGTTYIAGGDGGDRLSGGSGDDTIDGGDGGDTMTGGEGNDSIDGGPYGDTIDGGNGNDHLVGGAARDTVTGGWGDDTIDIRDGESDGLADCGVGNDSVLTDPIDTAWLDCEAVNP